MSDVNKGKKVPRESLNNKAKGSEGVVGQETSKPPSEPRDESLGKQTMASPPPPPPPGTIESPGLPGGVSEGEDKEASKVSFTVGPGVSEEPPPQKKPEVNKKVLMWTATSVVAVLMMIVGGGLLYKIGQGKKEGEIYQTEVAYEGCTPCTEEKYHAPEDTVTGSTLYFCDELWCTNEQAVCAARCSDVNPTKIDSLYSDGQRDTEDRCEIYPLGPGGWHFIDTNRNWQADPDEKPCECAAWQIDWLNAGAQTVGWRMDDGDAGPCDVPPFCESVVGREDFIVTADNGTTMVRVHSDIAFVYVELRVTDNNGVQMAYQEPTLEQPPYTWVWTVDTAYNDIDLVEFYVGVQELGQGGEYCGSWVPLAPSPSPSASPLPSPSPSEGLYCDSLEPDTGGEEILIGDEVRFVCSQGGTVVADHFDFRIHRPSDPEDINDENYWYYPDDWQGNGDGITSQFRIEEDGDWVVECRVCSDTTEDHCTEWGKVGGWIE